MLSKLLAGSMIALALAQPAIAQDITRLDPSLDAIVSPEAKVEKVHGDFRFTEGPVWIRDGGFLLFSDLMVNAIRKWTPAGGATFFRQGILAGPFPDGALIGSNGLTLDRQGRLVAAEHGNRRISRTETNGSITMLADRYEGKRLNSPNDLVVKSNGDVYFTDPPGLYRTYPDGPNTPQRELDFAGVYRVTGAGKLDLLTKEVPYPNGIAFSPDESKLYVANSRDQKFWMVFDVKADGTIVNGRKFFDLSTDTSDSVPDGMKVDRRGNVFATAPGGVRIFSPQGKQLGTIAVPEIASNLAWGNADSQTLYITARTGLYRIRLKTTGIRP
jgi:gluconolactonase